MFSTPLHLLFLSFITYFSSLFSLFLAYTTNLDKACYSTCFARLGPPSHWYRCILAFSLYIPLLYTDTVVFWSGLLQDPYVSSCTSIDTDTLLFETLSKMVGPRGGPSRKSHTKSRNGCKTCKRRHIRCDESFPQWYESVGLKDSRHTLTPN